MPTLYHAKNTRSMRVLWVLEELGVNAEIRSLPFPPSKLQPDYLSVNPTGTVPTLIDGPVRLTESMAICEYLAAKHDSPLLVGTGDPARIEFVQWLWYGESTLMTPLSRMATVGRLQRTGPDIDAVIEDARNNTGVRLAALERRLEGRDFLVAGRLTLADISAGYPLHLVGLNGMDHLLGPRSTAYRERLRSRPAYQRAIAIV
jgi:glutathione S-transferase